MHKVVNTINATKSLASTLLKFIIVITVVRLVWLEFSEYAPLKGTQLMYIMHQSCQNNINLTTINDYKGFLNALENPDDQALQKWANSHRYTIDVKYGPLDLSAYKNAIFFWWDYPKLDYQPNPFIVLSGRTDYSAIAHKKVEVADKFKNVLLERQVPFYRYYKKSYLFLPPEEHVLTCSQ